MYILKTEQSFDSAHFLAGYQGKCSNLHGHRWRVVVEIWSENLVSEGQLRGMVTDFGDIKADLQKLTDDYDHALIVEKGSLKETTVQALEDENFRIIMVPFRPTAEHFSRHFYDALKDMGYQVRAVEVYETPNNCAVYME
ncbi:MAG: 6-carboxytetrahydropterin synthase [Eubacterium sp.]|nr:6-carboxytetrahydropterin synthase [Eubacterium sp.]